MSLEGTQGYKRCNRCGYTSMILIRDSVAMRRETLYRMLWYRCPQCQDVGFSQQPVQDTLPDPADTVAEQVRSLETSD